MTTTDDTDYAVPTGDFISEWLEDNGLTQTDLARRAGVSRKHLNRIIAGAPLTPDVAERISLVTGVPARRWLALEAQYRADLARLAHVDALNDRLDLVDALASSATALRSLGIVDANRRNPGLLLRQFMSFFRVGDADELEATLSAPAFAMRQSNAHVIDGAAVATWLRLGEVAATASLDSLNEYNEDRLRAALPELRALTRSRAWDRELGHSLAELGVAFQPVPPVDGCRAYGAARWVNGHPVIQVSLRRKDDGQFWFTVFHEIGHVLLHARGELFIEGAGSTRSEDELEADEFASSTLIPQERAAELSGLKSIADVRTFARSVGVADGVVVGRLHHNGYWPPTHGQKLFRRVNFAD